MSALHVTFWLIGLYASVWSVFAFVGAAGLVHMFPEGRRWWLLPAQLASLTAFAAVVHFHPF